MKKIIEHFNKIFKTKINKNISTNRMQLLKVIFEGLEDKLYSQDKNYKELKKRYFEISNKLEEALSTNQKELFEKCWELTNEMNSTLEFQLFAFGYLIANELNEENDLA